MKKYEVLKHTADLRLKVRANNLKELFKNAVLGMLFLIFDFNLENVAPDINYKIEMKNPAMKGEVSSRRGKFIQSVAFHPRAEARGIQCDLLINSINKESLLIEFLNKVLYVLEVEKVILYKFNFIKLTENNLLAEAKGIKLDSFKQPQIREIKAATYHNIEIKRKGKLLETEIVFDV